MWIRGAFLVLSTLAVTFAAGAPCDAGGAWPRGKGNVFASLSYSTFGDVQGYVTGLTTRIPGIEPPKLTEELGIFVEYGLTDTLTFGLDRTSRAADRTIEGLLPGVTLKTLNSVFFLRKNFSRPGWRSSYGIEIGAGSYTDWRQIDDTQLRLGLSWGRGFETPWFGGWAEVDAKAAVTERTETVYWKVDSTIGIKPTERGLIYLQMQSGAVDDYGTYTRAQPTYVMKINEKISLESAVLLGIHNDDAQGMKVGAWLEF